MKILTLALLLCTAANASTPLPAPPAAGWCGTQAGSVWNGVQACPAPPPPIGNRLQFVNTSYPPAVATSVRRPALEWSSVFGHRTTTDAEQPFPGFAGANVYLSNVTPTTYIALHFVNNQGAAFAGTLKSASNFPGAIMDMKISTQAGDFSGTPDACLKLRVPPTDAVAITYTNAPGNAYRCQLPAEGYLNLRASGAGNTLHLVLNHN